MLEDLLLLLLPLQGVQHRHHRLHHRAWEAHLVRHHHQVHLLRRVGVALPNLLDFNGRRLFPSPMDR